MYFGVHRYLVLSRPTIHGHLSSPAPRSYPRLFFLCQWQPAWSLAQFISVSVAVKKKTPPISCWISRGWGWINDRSANCSTGNN